MSRIARKFRKWTVDAMGLPGDLVFELPRITLVGGKQLLIENHRGVLHFSEERLSLALSEGGLEVTGKDLVIKTIMPQEVMVEGDIAEIKYRGTGEKP
ncbi:sporulation protein YqfC [Paenibacillus yonginensis]|uniref:Sporulation protein YqfC n=1 Tax=Paenibacillus yonginensis TaxID=1462996 RepID=A0A1B1N146_9BACL|nr:sporulation protein YqfC [Paenibacillus yonginensis]ANS75160.1 sporulation protein YqfC [Paenibacillus yonginensis]